MGELTKRFIYGDEDAVDMVTDKPTKDNMRDFIMDVIFPRLTDEQKEKLVVIAECMTGKGEGPVKTDE